MKSFLGEGVGSHASYFVGMRRKLESLFDHLHSALAGERVTVRPVYHQMADSQK